MHTQIDLRGSIPNFIEITEGKLHDINILDLLILKPGAFYFMDRAYLDFERLSHMDQSFDLFCCQSGKNAISATGGFIQTRLTKAKASNATKQ